MMRTIACVVFLFFWPPLFQSGLAQTAHAPNAATFLINHIGVNDGLTQGSVYYMLKDSRGFLWFGTQDGLNRYDGHRFRTYRPVVTERGAAQPGTIRGVNIFGLVEDPDGNLWVGTEEGLNRYDRQRDRFDCFFGADHKPKKLSSRILPFFVDKTELLYLSDAEGLVRFDYRSQRKTILAAGLHPTKEYDLPNSTVRTAAGDVWLHAPKGLMRFNLKTRTLSHYFSDHPKNLFGSAQTVFSFFIDAEDIVWLGTGSGLIRFDYHRQTYQNYGMVGTAAISAIYSIAPDQRGRLWLGTQRDGVLFFDKRSRLFGQIADHTNITTTWRLNDFEISKVFVDDLGIVWANADPDGLARIVPDAFLLKGVTKRQSAGGLPPDQKLSSYTIRGFLEERFDRLWVVNENGIDVIDPRTNRVIDRYLRNLDESDLPTHNLARCVYRDPQRRIWVGRSDGVFLFHPETKSFEPILFPSSNHLVANNYVRNLVSISDTTLIAATEDGLYALNTRRHLWSAVPVLSGQNTFSLWYDARARQLWVGTFTNGYYCYKLVPDNGQRTGASSVGWTWRPIKAGLKGYTVLHIRPDEKRETLWLACDRGLVELKPGTGRFRLFNERQGLSNAFVYGSLTDTQDNIWMSTNRGISRLNPATYTIKNFSLNDGLQGYEFNGNAFYRTASGELYFGGVNGFNRFLPDQFRSSSFNPLVHIYSLNIDEQKVISDTYVGEATTIPLTYNQNTLSLEFAAIDYMSNGHNAYQYQLTGYDEHWVSAGERNYVRYANLPPGDYTFQVKAANKDAHWSPHVRRLHIRIDPPFWQKAPFMILIAILAGSAGLAWVRRREYAIRQQQADRLRLAYEIQEQVKKDIARDLHDEIGTRLATIKLYTAQLTQRIGETPDVISLKTTIFNLINDTISDIRNLLRKLNPKTLEQHGYVAAVDELFSRVNASGVISTQIVLDDRSDVDFPGVQEVDKLASRRFSTDTEVMLYRITQELISNSLKHANAHRIVLQIQWQPDRLVLIYTDDGRGFEYGLTRQTSTGLGLGSIESRVAILNGRVTWQTQPEQGICVIIDVPIDTLPRRGGVSSVPRSSLPN